MILLIIPEGFKFSCEGGWAREADPLKLILQHLTSHCYFSANINGSYMEVLFVYGMPDIRPKISNLVSGLPAILMLDIRYPAEY